MTGLLDWKNRVWSVFTLSLAVLACGPQGTVTSPGTGNGSGGGGGDGGVAIHTLKVTVTGNGSVTSSPAGIDCGTTCSASFPQGTAITLTAKPGAGSNLTAWSGACAGTNTCIVPLDGDATVGATFVAEAPPPPPPPPSPPPPPPAPPPNADECAGLAPDSLPPAVVAQVDTPDAPGPCTSGDGDDGDGAFALGWVDDIDVSLPSHRFFQIQDGKAVRVGGMDLGSDEGSRLLFSQPAGFTAFGVFTFGEVTSILDTWSHDGVLVSRTTIVPLDFKTPANHDPTSAAAVDPSGGTAVVKSLFTEGKGFTTTYQRLDKNGVAETGEVLVDTGEHPVGAVGVALSGHALILLSLGSSNWQARWVARDGTAISKPFTLQGSGVPRSQFLMDGSLALGFVKFFDNPPSSFAYRIEDGAEVAGPLPTWLSQRSGNVVFAARQGRAYATWGGGGQCGADLEVLAAPSGKSCGCLKVPQLTHLASVGRDGSLIVPGQAPFHCAYDLYPKLLR